MIREGRVLISTAGKPAWGAGYSVQVLEVGAQAATSSTGPTLTVRPGHGFAVGDKMIVGTDKNRFRLIDAVTPTTLHVTDQVSVAANEYIVNLAGDTGTTEPAYDGNGLTVYTDMGYVNQAFRNTVTTDAKGFYRYHHKGISRWELVRSAAGLEALYIETEGSSATYSPINVMNLGASGDGITDDYEAINSAVDYAEALGAAIYFPTGQYVIGSNLDIPYSVGVTFDFGATILPDIGVTVRIQGPIDAGLYKIFGGDGSILLFPASSSEVLYGPSSISEAPIQWWGCIPAVTPDCGPAIATALFAVAPGCFLTFHGGTFKIATPVAVTRRYFNMRGETGGYHPGAGYPTFIWTGVNNGTMFTFTNPFGIKVEMCAFDGDFSAATVFKAQSDSIGTVSWNCHWDRCTFTACRGDAFVMGGAHPTYRDDFLQALFTHCWFDRPSGRSSDADGNSVSLSSIPAGRHFMIRAWNSWNVRFEACHFFSIGVSSDTNQYERQGIYAQGGELVFQDCFFYNRGSDIFIADPAEGASPPPGGEAISYIRIYGGESQSEELIRFPSIVASAFTTPVRSYLIQGIRHVPSFASYTPFRTTSIYWEGPASSNQYVLVLDTCTFNRDVYIGTNVTNVIDIGCRFSPSRAFTGFPSKIFGVLGTRSVTGHEAYGHGLRIGSNVMRFGPLATTGYLKQHDIRFNNETDDTVLALDFLQKWTQADGSVDPNVTGQMTTFFGSPNYQGDSQTKVNGVINFDPVWAAGELRVTTKVRPQRRGIYELIWRCDSGDNPGEHDYCAGTGHIYVMRDKVGGNDDLWRISYRENTQYDNVGQVTPRLLTITAFFWNGTTETVTIPDGQAEILAPYVIRLRLATMVEDRHTTFYGALRRIL